MTMGNIPRPARTYVAIFIRCNSIVTSVSCCRRTRSGSGIDLLRGTNTVVLSSEASVVVVVAGILGNFGKMEARLKIDSKDVLGEVVVVWTISLTGTLTVVVVVVLLLVVLDDDVVDVDSVVVIVFFGRGENLLTGLGVVLLKSTESIDEGVISILLGTTGRRVVEGFCVEGLYPREGDGL